MDADVIDRTAEAVEAERDRIEKLLVQLAGKYADEGVDYSQLISEIIRVMRQPVR